MQRRKFEADLRFSRRKSLIVLGSATAFFSLKPLFAAANNTAAINWEEISKQFLIDDSLTYLNTGSLGATPRPVLEYRREVERKLESNPVGEGFGSVLTEAEKVREKLADLIGCELGEVTVTRNTTEGVDFIAEGINLQPGQRVLTSNNEHPGGLAAWKFLKKYRGVELDVADVSSPPRSEDEVVDAFAQAIKPDTRVIFCSHVMFSNGVQPPIARLSQLAHQHNCLMVVDGAQAPGGVAVDVKQLGCDAYAASGHKFLLGGKGTGLLYISTQAQKQIKPMQLDDGYGFYTAIRGTNCMPEVISLGGAIDWVKQIGRDAVLARLMSLRNSLYGVLAKTQHILINSPPPGSSMASQLVCFSVTDRERHKKLQEQFARDKVLVRGIGINGIDFRLTVHLYNTEADIAKFAESLQKGVA